VLKNTRQKNSLSSVKNKTLGKELLWLVFYFTEDFLLGNRERTSLLSVQKNTRQNIWHPAKSRILVVVSSDYELDAPRLSDDGSFLERIFPSFFCRLVQYNATHVMRSNLFKSPNSEVHLISHLASRIQIFLVLFMFKMFFSASQTYVPRSLPSRVIHGATF
jgi:hypothetical protein